MIAAPPRGIHAAFLPGTAAPPARTSRSFQMSRLTTTVAILSILALAGCYRATVETGRAPSGQTIQQDWAHGFIFGLVPPSTVSTAAECPNGVALVRTELSFLNQLATALTFGLYTPMTIRVECAAPAAAMGRTDAGTISLAEGATRAELAQALGRAARQSSESGQPVYVQFAELR
jgi:hypothetical protein